jgi:UDP-galactose transporter B1
MSEQEGKMGEKKAAPAAKSEGSLLDLRMLFLCAGVLTTFTAFGYAQEAVTGQEFGASKERFKEISFLVLLQTCGNCVVSAIFLLATGNSNFSAGVPITDWLKVAVPYKGAHQFGLMALGYIPFPLQVVCKSCKAIPVMIGETIFAGKVHPRKKQLAVVLMCIGVVSFTLLGKSKKGKDDGSTYETMIGLGFVLLALICDGIYGPYQNKICQDYKPSSHHLMFNMNLWEGLAALVTCLATGQLSRGIAFCQAHPEIIPKMMIFCSMMAVGNIFIFLLQANYGALVVTITTTMRKLISVLFSVFMFGHAMHPLQWVCVFFVFFSGQIAGFIVSTLNLERAPAATEMKKKA